MPRSSQSLVLNILLRNISAADYALLQPHLETVRLQKRSVMVTPNQPIAHIYFPESGVGSIVAVSPEGQRVEAGIFGRDGMSGLATLFGSDRSPSETFMQIEGSAQRLSTEAFREAIDKSRTLLATLLRFAQAMSVQSSYTSLSNAVHSLPERLARWILMCHDRMDGDGLPLTHEFMGMMLGVRRPSVTTTLHVLEGGHFIRATRGMITVRDRAGLEDLAADAYGVPEADYERLIAPISKRDGNIVQGRFLQHGHDQGGS